MLQRRHFSVNRVACWWYTGSMQLRLRELREARFLSQQDLATKAGIARTTVTRLETAQRQPTWQTLQRLAAALGVEPGELVVRE